MGVSKFIPPAIRRPLRRFVTVVRYGGRRFSCPICEGRFRRMKPFVGSFSVKGDVLDHRTDNAICPRCGSDIRHRFVFTFLKEHTGLLVSALDVLHFAPEAPLLARLSRCRNLRYTTADIAPECFPGAVRADITDLQFADATFDGVICIHVLEHIEDDRRALRELYRVVRPGGWAAIAIPVFGAQTYEVPGLSAEQRAQMYGATDHVRLNGLDFVDKISSAGFGVDVVTFDDVPGTYLDRSVRSPHVDSDRVLFFCRR